MCRGAMLFVLPVLWVGSAIGGDDAAKSDMQLFQGAWRPVFVRNPEGQLASDEELKAARDRSARARAEVDRLEAEIKKLERMSSSERDALREEIKREVKEDVSASAKEVVGS